MVFPVIGGDGKPTGYEIDNSLRFSDTNYLTRDNTTQSGGGTNFTFSAWLKMTPYSVGGYQGILSIFKDSNDYFEIYKDNSEKLQICQNINGTSVCYQNQDFTYRDYSAWYHLVVSFNNSASGEINKIKTYVNGQEISADEKVTNGNPFADVGLGDSAYDTRVGAYRDNTDPTWNGYMADVHLIAGQTLAASYFGETNDNGVWIPKKYTGTFGGNGFKLEFQQTGTSQNSSGMGADTSGEDNHLAVTGLSSVDVTTDTPTNNFCTINPIDVGSGHTSLTISEGNTKVVKSSTESNPGDGDRVGTTMKFTKGKWYWEEKAVSGAATGGNGIYSDKLGGPAHWHDNYGYYFDPNGNESNSGSQIARRQENDEIGYGSSAMDDVSNNDIIMCALDLDNNRWYIGVNGQWSNNNAASGGTATANSAFNQSSLAGYFTIPSGGNGGFWGPFFGPAGSTTAKETQFNFGNPPFSISSGNSDANGYGNFEYAVPSGYYSMCTKNLAEYG